MNKEILLQAADAIEANPKHFDMDSFYGYECGTTACIVGWAGFIYTKSGDFGVFVEEQVEARPGYKKKLLEAATGLDFESNEMDALCLTSQWLNEEILQKFRNAKTSQKKANAAAEYVRWFIATGAGKNQ